MALELKENHKEIKDEIQKERRSFLKKTAYTVPSIVALGSLARPTHAMADSTNAINNDTNLGSPDDFWNN